MKFKKVFRGYDPKEVDKHLTETALKEQQIRVSQKERIDELLEENRTLHQSVKQYQADEQAISKALIEAQNITESARIAAEKYYQSAVLRAKIFCASWQAYAATFVAALSDDEVCQFNGLQRQIENLVAEYEGEQVKEVAAAEAQSTPNQAVRALFNPITRVEGVADQVIDLNELVTPSQSLEEICLELGIIKK